jgi:hypothetical protein
MTFQKTGENLTQPTPSCLPPTPARPSGQQKEAKSRAVRFKNQKKLDISGKWE